MDISIILFWIEDISIILDGSMEPTRMFYFFLLAINISELLAGSINRHAC
jgi:hypothetical protein